MIAEFSNFELWILENLWPVKFEDNIDNIDG